LSIFAAMFKKSSLYLLFILMLSLSCSKYQKILKSSDVDLKYEAAQKYYDEGKYDRAIPLLEELIPLLRGTDRAEKVYFLYAYSNYQSNLLYAAAYHFKKFATTYPTSKHVEEMLFMHGYSQYLLSPIPELDQTETYNAINSLQIFINTFPEHNLVDSSNVLMDKLRVKLETKSYQNAKQYFKIQDYKASIVALGNHIKDYPDTKHIEELNFLILKSHYLLAVNSIKEKKLERIGNTIEAYYNFADSFGESKYLKEAQNIYSKMEEEQNKIKLENL